MISMNNRCRQPNWSLQNIPNTTISQRKILSNTTTRKTNQTDLIIAAPIPSQRSSKITTQLRVGIREHATSKFPPCQRKIRFNICALFQLIPPFWIEEKVGMFRAIRPQQADLPVKTTTLSGHRSKEMIFRQILEEKLKKVTNFTQEAKRLFKACHLIMSPNNIKTPKIKVTADLARHQKRTNKRR